MNCLDCANDGRKRDAVAVCRVCGAAICLEHAEVQQNTLTRSVPGGMTMMQVPLAPAARLIRCMRCDAGYANERKTG